MGNHSLERGEGAWSHWVILSNRRVIIDELNHYSGGIFFEFEDFLGLTMDGKGIGFFLPLNQTVLFKSF